MVLNDNRRCFACGPENPIGLHLDFWSEGDRVKARFTPHPDHQGYAGITHGGILATVMDEAMATLLWRQDSPVVTAKFEMRLRQPAQAGTELLVEAWQDGGRGRFCYCEAKLTDPSGAVVAEAKGSFVKMPPAG